MGAVLERSGHSVVIYDCQLGITHKELVEMLLSDKPELVGISATTPTFPSALGVGQKVKQSLPETIVVIGGVHVTALPQETMSFDCFDIAVLGEGEKTMGELAAHLENKGTRRLKKVAGIAYRENGTVKFTKPRGLIQDLDSLPYPARHLLPPLSAYKPTPASYRKLPLAHLITTRGCPYQCTFCDRSIFGSKYRSRSVENVMGEIEELVDKYGIREIKFFDDTFTLDRKRVFEICKEFKERKIDLSWSCLTRVDTISREMLVAMKDAGCWQVLFGLESGDPRMLSLLKKGSTVEQNERAVQLAHEVGLSVRADFIVGTLGETLESMERTLRFAIGLNMDFAHFNKFTPYPGTELYHNLTKMGYTFDFTSRSCSQLDHSYIMYTPEGITEQQLREFVDMAYKRYYLRPKYILRQIRQIQSFTDISRLVDGFFAVYYL